jgi:nucleoside-diphosphate-sugar epimerase
MLRHGGAEPGDSLRLVRADLQNDEGWREAADGCDYVLHVASPTLTQVPRSDDEMIRPAVDGALRVLRAARDAGVRRVCRPPPSARSPTDTASAPPRSPRKTGRTWTPTSPRTRIGRNLDATSAKAEHLLGWKPRPLEDTIVDTAESLLALP